ncbi:membrane protein insertion efficiency factor YidD [Mycobacterium botniense]|uniref:membrane protein insertion efficiency factor YidD n=1 Tax=Mycobacterium botniense TaxID=84962 RepID=UPI0013D15FFE
MNTASRWAARLRNARTAPVRGVIATIQLYRHMISPLRLPTCRFMPTCSQYAVEALNTYGLVRGGWLAIIRLSKCGPWHRGGWDPVPEPDSRRENVAQCIRCHRGTANVGESESFV